MVPVVTFAMTWNSMRTHWFFGTTTVPVATIAPVAFASTRCPALFTVTTATRVPPSKILTSRKSVRAVWKRYKRPQIWVWVPIRGLHDTSEMEAVAVELIFAASEPWAAWVLSKANEAPEPMFVASQASPLAPPEFAVVIVVPDVPPSNVLLATTDGKPLGPGQPVLLIWRSSIQKGPMFATAA